MSIFHSAAIRCYERDHADRVNEGAPTAVRPHVETHLPLNEWIIAVVKGADEHSLRSHHLLVLGGLMIGLSTKDEEFISSHLGMTLQTAFVNATNLALLNTPASDRSTQATIALALNHAFIHLSDMERSKIDYDRLLPGLMNSTFHSQDGLRSGYFLGAADAELHQVSSDQFNWPATAGSYRQIETILQSPLVSSLGPLSRLIAHTIENVQGSWLVLSAVEDLADFCRTINIQWRQNKLSEIDTSEEAIFLHDEARKTTVPTLWRLLRASLFAIVIILRSAVGRVVGDPSLAGDDSMYPSLTS